MDSAPSRQTTTPRLAKTWLARRCVAWSRQAKAEQLPELEQALLSVASAAVDAHLTESRQTVRRP